MQVFRDLYIRGEPDQLAATAQTISTSLTGDWTRDTEAEERMRELALRGEGSAYCFKRMRRGRRPAVTLFLTEKDKTTYSVANIVSHEQHDLSYAEYNGILEEFYKQFVQPAAAQTGARSEISAAEEDLENWVSLDTAKKLRLFSSAATKSTGSSHPMDRERWYDFIVSAHREGTDLDSSTLARWLHETGGWDEERSYKLAIEYEFARGLLTHADKQTVGV